jgi:hypothetical protein
MNRPGGIVPLDPFGYRSLACHPLLAHVVSEIPPLRHAHLAFDKTSTTERRGASGIIKKIGEIGGSRYPHIAGSSGMIHPMDVWLRRPSNLEVSTPIISGLEPAKGFWFDCHLSWRFAHTYSTPRNGFWSTSRGNVSQDGRFFVQFRLGGPAWKNTERRQLPDGCFCCRAEMMRWKQNSFAVGRPA